MLVSGIARSCNSRPQNRANREGNIRESPECKDIVTCCFAGRLVTALITPARKLRVPSIYSGSFHTLDRSLYMPWSRPDVTFYLEWDLVPSADAFETRLGRGHSFLCIAHPDF
jgi:hypothetical protein